MLEQGTNPFRCPGPVRGHVDVAKRLECKAACGVSILSAESERMMRAAHRKHCGASRDGSQTRDVLGDTIEDDVEAGLLAVVERVRAGIGLGEPRALALVLEQESGIAGDVRLVSLGEPVLLVRKVFDAVALRLGTGEHRRTVRHASDRLHRARTSEAAVLHDTEDEIDRLIGLWTDQSAVELRSGLQRYHRRRLAAVPNIVAQLSRFER